MAYGTFSAFTSLLIFKSFVNNSLKLVINKLSLAFRTRLSHHAHEEYLKGIVFYKVSNLDNRIQNIDQLLTQV